MGVDGLLELGEHRLSEQRGAVTVEVSVDEVGTRGALGRGVQQVLVQQALVRGRGHLGHEDAIVCQVVWLAAVGIEAVHRVAQFVGHGKDGIQRAGIVHQDVRTRVVAAGGVSAGALAGALVPVHPASSEPAARRLDIIRAEGRQAAADQVDRLIVGVAQGHGWHHGHIVVVHVQGADAQQPLAQRHVAGEGGQGGVDCGDQGIVHGHVDGVLEQGGVPCGRVPPRPGAKDVRLDLAVERAGRRGTVAGPFAVVGRKRLPAHLAIRALLQGDEGGVREAALAALSVPHPREPRRQIHVLQHAVGALQSGQRLADHGQQSLLRRRQRVRLASEKVGQKERVRPQRLLLLPGGDGRVVNGEDLRRQIRPRRHQARIERPRAIEHSLGGAVGQVLIVDQVRVQVQPLDAPPSGKPRRQGLRQHCGGLVQAPGIGRDALRHALRASIVLLPGGGRRVEERQIPAVARGNLATGRELGHHEGCPFPVQLRFRVSSRRILGNGR